MIDSSRGARKGLMMEGAGAEGGAATGTMVRKFMHPIPCRVLCRGLCTPSVPGIASRESQRTNKDKKGQGNNKKQKNLGNQRDERSLGLHHPFPGSPKQPSPPYQYRQLVQGGRGERVVVANRGETDVSQDRATAIPLAGRGPSKAKAWVWQGERPRIEGRKE